ASSILPRSRAVRCKTPRPSQACCSPPKHWSPRFLKRKKLLQCHRAAWAAWTTKPKQHVNSNSRSRKAPAVLFSDMESSTQPNRIDAAKVEYGRWPQTHVPAQIKEAGTREMANYTVSLILRQRLIGSGTLIRVGDKHGILTAAHVAAIVENADQAIGIN